MKASSHSGEFTRKIRVQTNDPNTPSTDLTCKGKALVAFHTDPTLLNFGKIERDSGPVTKTVTLTRGDGGPLHPKLGSMESNLSAELREIEAGEKYALDITVNPPWPNDKLRGSVKIETGLEDAPEENVRIFGQLEPRLRAEPKSFVLPENTEQEADLRVTLVWAGPPGKAVGATATDPNLSAKLIEEGGQQIVTLHVPANYERKQKTATQVSVVTDDPAVSSLRIPISSSTAATAANKAIARPATLSPMQNVAPANPVQPPTTQPER